MHSDQSSGSGHLHVVLRDGDGNLLWEQDVENMITTAGDQYYTTKAAVGVGSGGVTAPAPANGMKLGTATTAAAKSGSGSYIASGATYIAGSNNAFDSGYPSVAAATGTDAGWEIRYQSTWPAGDATSANINEVEICTDQGTDAGHSSGAAVISRAVLPTPVNKTSTDSLTITWYHKYQGKLS